MSDNPPNNPFPPPEPPSVEEALDDFLDHAAPVFFTLLDSVHYHREMSSLGDLILFSVLGNYIHNLKRYRQDFDAAPEIAHSMATLEVINHPEVSSMMDSVLSGTTESVISQRFGVDVDE